MAKKRLNAEIILTFLNALLTAEEMLNNLDAAALP